MPESRFCRQNRFSARTPPLPDPVRAKHSQGADGQGAERCSVSVAHLAERDRVLAVRRGEPSVLPLGEADRRVEPCRLQAHGPGPAIFRGVRPCVEALRVLAPTVARKAGRPEPAVLHGLLLGPGEAPPERALAAEGARPWRESGGAPGKVLCGPPAGRAHGVCRTAAGRGGRRRVLGRPWCCGPRGGRRMPGRGRRAVGRGRRPPGRAAARGGGRVRVAQRAGSPRELHSPPRSGRRVLPSLGGSSAGGRCMCTTRHARFC
mmetsp:Transcript_1070/g.3593  ORF Transcript_1070/g.3593 Transcript_1070/m.3593 type:complete len:262 (-) Transcript_1070:33-818(-)